MPAHPRLNAWLKLAQGLLECPTAALREDLPAAHVAAFAHARPALFLKRDAVGNLLVGYPGNGAGAKAPIVLVAHLDHPGFWIEAIRGRTVELLFKGGVRLEHAVKGAPLAFYRRGEAKPTGFGKLEKSIGANGRVVSATARIERGTAECGGFTMWDFPGFSVRGGKIVSRCCDDLLGAAAAMCVLDELARSKPKGVAAWGLFTRAEEIGFYGALWAVKERWIPREARVISLECSRALAVAPQGAGPVVRVGDSASLFDPPFTEALRQACVRVQKEDPSFLYQRKLMDGGACEATAFCSAGYRSSGICVPLGNYHNQTGLDGGKKGIGPESVAVSDFAGEVRLLLELVRHGRGLAKLEGTTRQAMAKRTKEAVKAFRAHPLRG
ncbi:MAG: hypothetical protein HS116_04430 [Planctomycetes bacterium]|nr:hypothetical protein [Planctomycetota bacterium]